jgi:aspartyl-tRNA(Asn)/glutamyl-tRNA(Gln) amidotransferase subunit C
VSESQLDVAYVARLARIELSPAEIERFGAQLGALLEHVKALEALGVDGVAATAQVIPSSNVARDDLPVPSLPREVVLAQAPQAEGNYFRVPRIVAEA